MVAVNEEDENLELRYFMECSKKMNQRSWEENDLYSKVIKKKNLSRRSSPMNEKLKKSE